MLLGAETFLSRPRSSILPAEGEFVYFPLSTNGTGKPEGHAATI
jgi:hypothetical protein